MLVCRDSLHLRSGLRQARMTLLGRRGCGRILGPSIAESEFQIPVRILGLWITALLTNEPCLPLGQPTMGFFVASFVGVFLCTPFYNHSFFSMTISFSFKKKKR